MGIATYSVNFYTIVTILVLMVTFLIPSARRDPSLLLTGCAYATGGTDLVLLCVATLAPQTGAWVRIGLLVVLGLYLAGFIADMVRPRATGAQPVRAIRNADIVSERE